MAATSYARRAALSRDEAVRLAPIPTPAARLVYGGPIPVEWWRLDGAGHAPPSLAVPVATTMASGAQNRDVEFAELAWAFFAARLP